jgi:organic hydroperoxide reductase OsmC/OhrA
MAKEHIYKVKTEWRGGPDGTKNIRSYDRSHTVSIAGKPSLNLTTDNAAVGDPNKLNPEDLLVSAVSSCHMLSYLYVCSLEGVIITGYTDQATGIMIENEKDGGSFREIVLNPVCTVSDENMISKAISLHHKAHVICYIAGSVNFEIRCNPEIMLKE